MRFSIIRSVSVVLIASILFSIPAHPEAATAGAQTVSGSDKPLVVAHRGASLHAPENTMAAFHKAVEMGAHVIELDVRLTKDGIPVVIHDAKVNRTTSGKGKVAGLTFKQLRELDAGLYFHPSFAGERIPSLAEVLDTFSPVTRLLIELKDPKQYPGIEKAVAGMLKERSLDNSASSGIVVQSFDRSSLQKLKELLPQLSIGILVTGAGKLRTRELKKIAQYADYINPSRKGLSTWTIRLIQANGMKVYVWDIRSERQAAAMIKAGADGIMTKNPEFLHSLKNRLAK
ncbi:glycerophosphodiester phosphodiesterase [Paenibacillus sambharensis]|uniref:Glycerophosphodiester phosphodiesterase n=1 Tax=Paenibacillus sambharensis TaxID=1803190 RepID=A0A2W1L1X3_9BACL|nr:glycerophosphodiester phosphodiesterase family protein [Paenibacillus sambharensis]PZD93948.1 glycerophosphodiester phosphodiesterase [Paenibacillus sambharensis]